MSQFVTTTDIETGGFGARMKHLGVSLLPLGLFVTCALGYDHFAHAGSNEAPAAKVEETAEHRIAQLAPTAKPRAEQPSAKIGQMPATAPAAPPAPAFNPLSVLRDDRSLLDLSKSGQPARAGAGAGAAAAAPTMPLERSLELTLGSVTALPLGFASGPDRSPGNYAIVRGVPQSARLTHGISVGDTSWLIDGADIPRTAIEMRAGTPGRVPLEFTVLSSDSRILAREKLTLEVKPATAALAAAEPVRVPPAALAATTARAAGTEAQRVTRAVEAKSAAAAALTMRVARDTDLKPGRGSLLRVEIEPPAAVPTGAYVVLRGLPPDTALSRGIPMGADAWLLSLAELADLDVRVPAKVSGSIMLDARLVSSDGQLLAADQHVVATAVQLLSGEGGASAAKAPAAAANPAEALTTRAVPPNASTANVARAAGPLLDNAALVRGRRMLEIGNIAVARPLLERAAVEGSGEAAALLAASFDPSWLKKAGVVGVGGDATQSQHWYAEARRLGATDPERIVALTTVGPQRNR